MKLRALASALAVLMAAHGAHAEPAPADVPWQLQTLRGDSAPPKAMLRIRADGAVSGRGWCNAFGGRVEIDGNTIAFDGLIATMRACADARLTRLEADYLAALREAARWRVERGRLVLSARSGRVLLIFAPEGADVEGVPEEMPGG